MIHGSHLDRVLGAELVAFGICEDQPVFMLGQDGSAQLEEFVQVSLVPQPDVEMHPVLRGLGFGDDTQDRAPRAQEGAADVGSICTVCNCAGDRGRSSGAALQGEASNHRMLRRLRAGVVSDAEKAR
jgi:hypothetical protein